ncbi:ABC transporter ATP-binding protein [Streptomyces mangrovisoli]|uniref:ABC transporter ATP-binding protein n=1 Tax=Streptomyces mangrovisoli TaxID=1428628 RepID=A0A1J4NVU2_9ACTN|nr:ABC transporter ATP-binding protein [Streptomyces mangrovisoli]OIJ66459.1 ABC transporter ATP-binding protein [Streptomyces mangrovisoli]
MSYPPSPDVALAADGVSKRYRRRGPDVLDDCTFRIPAGVVCALVGPNGAGKSTLLELVAGMRRPTSGEVTVAGGAPRAGHPRVAYLAQHRPLFPRFTVAETLRLGARLNGADWDADLAERVADAGNFHEKDRIGDLSGGERTRVALALTLGKRADLLLLDEPMADLDVLARQEVMGLLMAHVADTGATVVMSSHIISELADACDHLLLLDQGAARLCGDIDELTASHAVVTLAGGPERLAGHTVIESRPAGRGTSALIRPSGAPLPADWEVRTPSLEELVLAHLGAPATPRSPVPPTPDAYLKEPAV